MINEKNEKIIQDLLKYDIKYPLTVKGFDDREYKVSNVYINSNKIIMKITIKGIIYIEKLCEYSLYFQENLINQLKKFENSIWDD